MHTNDFLRKSFEENPQLYDRARPGYPEALIEDVIALSQISDGGNILEIGCGTGQATAPFAARGYKMLCLDIGKKMAEFAAAKLCTCQAVTVAETSFEDWAVKPEGFDLVISATAFHWIQPEISYSKSAAALKESGTLAVFRNYHPLPDSGFFNEVNAIYKNCAPEIHCMRPTGIHGQKDRTEADIDKVRNDFKNSGLFAEVEVRRYPWSQTYAADEYVSLLNTYSDHITLPENKKNALLNGIRELIQRKYSKVTKDYLAVLWCAKKR